MDACQKQRSPDGVVASAHLGLLVQGIDAIVWEADPSTFRFTFVNSTAERLLGYPCSAWYEQDFWPAHIHPDDREQAVRFCMERTQEGTNHSFEYRMIGSKQQEIWLRDTVTVEVRDGIPVKLFGIMVDITAQKLAQSAMAEQFHFLWQLVDTIPSPIFWKDMEGRYGGCNRAFEAYIGLDRESLVGKTVYDIAPPDLARVYEAADNKLFTEGGTQTYQADVQYADGSRRNVIFYKARLTLKNNAPGGLVGVMLDISEQKNLERHLQKERQTLQTIMDFMPTGISLVDADLNVVVCNTRAREIMGFPDELFANGALPLATLFQFNAERGEYGPGDTKELVRFRVERARKFLAHRAERTRPDGSVIAITGVPIDGGGFVTNYLDITDRRRAEEALKLTAIVFEQSTEGIVLTDRNGMILRTNRAFEKITGYTEMEVKGKSPGISVGSGRQDRDFYQKMWQSLKTYGHWSGEVVNRRKSGELYSEFLSITRVDDSTGEPSNYIGIFTDLTDAKNAQLKIERLSFFDALTNLPIRSLLISQLDEVLQANPGSTRKIALITTSVGSLSSINETLGHHYGDKLLLAFAQRLLNIIPENSTLYRHTGDGFAIVVWDEANAAEVKHLIHRILAACGLPFFLDPHSLTVEMHLGISLPPEGGADAASLLRNADAALHFSKQSGMRGYEYFREEMNKAAMERLVIESSINQAMERNEFRVFYQPQVDLPSGKISGMEALIRWSHADMGMISPAKFIPIAESTGQIVALGEWVLREACRATATFHNEGYPSLRVAVNVSARQFAQANFAPMVIDILAETGLAADCLELELTESMIMQRPAEVISVMKTLKAHGVTFSIDDFGTGHSSLSQLKRFPIDKLKIDQSFIRDIAACADGTAITEAVIALGHALRLKVLAEGVETEGQRQFLSAAGCHGFQGYLYSPAIPEDQLVHVLKRGEERSSPPIEWHI